MSRAQRTLASPSTAQRRAPRARAAWLAWSARLASPHVLLAAAIALHLVFFLSPYGREDRLIAGFIPLSFHDSGRVLTGAVPYRDFLLEYPPGTLLFMMVPRVFATGYLDYQALFRAEVAALDVIVLLALYASARAAGLPLLRVLALYTLAIVLLGRVAADRLDLAPTALMALAVLAWQRERPALSAVALAAGTATKVYPLLLLPPLLMDAWTRGRWPRVRATSLVFVVTLIPFLSPMLLAFLLGPQGVIHALRFQTSRHVEVESIWATLPLLLHLATGFPLQVAFRYRAYGILGPGDAMGGLGTPVLALVVLAIYWRWWQTRTRDCARTAMLFVGTTALALAAAVLSKVLSPQYLIWAMPSLALLPPPGPATGGRPAFRRIAVAVVAFVVALPLTHWIYPLHFGELVRLLTPSAVGVLALRNALLILALGLLLSAVWQISRQAPADDDRRQGVP